MTNILIFGHKNPDTDTICSCIVYNNLKRLQGMDTEAVRLGVSRALCEINEEFRLLLKPHGLLTRDARMVERKKPGQKKARKRFQFSKR